MSNDWPPPMFRDRVPAVTGAYPARPGNLVRPIVDGVPTFRRIAEAIEAARHSVWLTVAFCAPDFRFADGRGLLAVLGNAVARGLDVRVLSGGRIRRAVATAAPSLARRRNSNCSVPAVRSSASGGTGPGGPTASTRNPGSPMPAIPPRRPSSAAST